MNEIKANARLTIHEGQLEAFKEAAQACLKSVREKDTGTLQYDWFLDGDETVCIVHERYRDSEALLEHMGNLGEQTMGALLSVVDLSLEMYGTPSQELQDALAGFGVNFYGPYLSL